MLRKPRRFHVTSRVLCQARTQPGTPGACTGATSKLAVQEWSCRALLPARAFWSELVHELEDASIRPEPTHAVLQAGLSEAAAACGATAAAPEAFADMALAMIGHEPRLVSQEAVTHWYKSVSAEVRLCTCAFAIALYLLAIGSQHPPPTAGCFCTCQLSLQASLSECTPSHQNSGCRPQCC